MKRLLAIAALILSVLPAAAAGSRTTVTPPQSDDLFTNPGMGWQTFHRFANEDPNLQALPSSSAYFRFYWKEVEPTEGAVDFKKFDDLLAHARRAGQKLAFRIMCVGTGRDYLYVPQWLKDSGCPGFEYRYGGAGATHWIPDMNHPLFQKAHFRLLDALGKRYDGHPDLDLVDIGTVGHWGEWHMSQTPVALPSLETRLAIVERYVTAFPKTPKVMLIGDADGMRFAVAAGCGWRADCLGDMGGFSKTWCHMRDFYPQQIVKTAAADAWKEGPVAFESCWDMRRWKDEGWDIRAIFDFALAHHASYLNNKSAPIPDGTREEIERFLRRIGYRLILRALEHDASVARGSPLALSMEWDNVGAAPPYRDWRLAVRLTKGENSCVLGGATTIAGWLPGTRRLTESVNIPTTLEPGRYELSVGIVDPGTKQPAVRLAIAGRTPDGWYPLSHVEVTAP